MRRASLHRIPGRHGQRRQHVARLRQMWLLVPLLWLASSTLPRLSFLAPIASPGRTAGSPSGRSQLKTRTPPRSKRRSAKVVVWAAVNGDASSRVDRYKMLTPREHVLQRPDMYIGPVEPRLTTDWVLKKQQFFLEEADLMISPGLIQLYNEILVNAIDRQFAGSKRSTMTAINVTVDAGAGRISVWNDGGAIPVQIHPDSQLYTPTLVFGEFLSGDNFDDSKIRFIGGRNGVGAKATNAFSSVFEVVVEDPEADEGRGLHFRQRWKNNMAERQRPTISSLNEDITKGSVMVTFKPDLQRFGLKRIDQDHMKLLRARAVDAAACTQKGIQVTFNEEVLEIASFKDYAQRVLGEEVAVLKLKDDKKRVRAEIAVGFAKTGGFKALGLVNGIRCSSGTHVKYVADQLANGIVGLVKNTPGCRRSVAPGMVKQFLKIVVKVLVDNPDFDSQTKTRLTTTSSKLGFDLALPEDFFQKVAELGVLDAALKASETAATRALQKKVKSSQLPSLANLEDASKADKPGSFCTLVLTEGGSAKALAVAGLAKLGRANYGVFPLKGKMLNVRAATPKALAANVEIRNLVQIIGLEWGKVYETPEDVASLRYQRVMIFSDQDLHGHHIAGLVINFIEAQWPSLLQVEPRFLQRFATPIVKVFSRRTNESHEFFTEGDYHTWEQQQDKAWTQEHRVKYYKGLGTSTREEAIRYFSNMDRHLLELTFTTPGDKDAVRLAFDPKKIPDRKAWLNSHKPGVELNYTQKEASISDFFHRQFVQFSLYDCECNIPLLLDGLKPSQRKVWHVARNLRTTEMKVAQLTGRVSAETAYHHGEEALVGTIVNMAQDFVGTNNVNLLEPIGMFGTRLAGRAEHASARYIYTKMSPLADAIFLRVDDNILRLRTEDGQKVEPESYLPVVPLVLMNGFKGIGTGWATDCPNYNPLDVTDRLKQLIQGNSLQEPMVPWYDKNSGVVERTEDGKIYSYGVWSLYNSKRKGDVDTVRVTELPIGVWTNDFISSIEEKAKNLNVMMSIHKCPDHDDQRVHLLIGFESGELRKMIKYSRAGNLTEKIGQFLGLRTRLHTSNIMLYHTGPDRSIPKLQHFKSPEEVLTAFYLERKQYYEQRRQRQLSTLKVDHSISSNKLRFLEESMNGSLDLTRTIEEVQKDLQAANYIKMQTSGGSAGENSNNGGVDAGEDEATEGSELPEVEEGEGATDSGYDYLLKMSFLSRTKEHTDRLQGQLRRVSREIKNLESITPEAMWLKDIKSFETAYKRHLELDDSRPAGFSQEEMDEDEAAAQAEFNRERQRRAKKTIDVDEPVSSISWLTRKTLDELRGLCRQRGLKTNGKKPDLINRLLTSVSEQFEEAEFGKLNLQDLQAHCQAQGLPVAGSKAELIARLSRSSETAERETKTNRELKDCLRDFGIRGFSSMPRDQMIRVCDALRGRVEEEQIALKGKTSSELKDHCRVRGLKVGGGVNELVLRIAEAKVVDEAEDILQSCGDVDTNRIPVASAGTTAWHAAVAQARAELNDTGFGIKKGSPTYSRARDILEEMKAEARIGDAG
eukprot:TRINITY_DN24359_c0_g1_i1.p1 TRINITY_DN24359_c0_g1~~TRINITY_DN24359_c0_g1_i1.p1  ORF type:complete len:1549 (-),score=384.97 TRINITY_DN24359_c0_g1_i1:485-5131(-)